MEKINTDIVISINVHENTNFLMKQIENIHSNIIGEYSIVLNCNSFMFEKLRDIRLPERVYINPEIINKKRFHGSLTKGIVSNMGFSLEKFAFKYFLILSSRTFFYKTLSVNILCEKQQIFPNLGWFHNNVRKLGRKFIANKLNGDKWRWPSISQSKLAKYYINKGHPLYWSGHEGLSFHFNVCKTIVKFLNEHEELREDLYNFNDCVEEVSLQTISHNEVDITNSKHYGFIDIGNGPFTFNTPPDNGQYVYKIWRV